jgi:hypothetical protein
MAVAGSHEMLSAAQNGSWRSNMREKKEPKPDPIGVRVILVLLGLMLVTLGFGIILTTVRLPRGPASEQLIGLAEYFVFFSLGVWALDRGLLISVKARRWQQRRRDKKRIEPKGGGM